MTWLHRLLSNRPQEGPSEDLEPFLGVLEQLETRLRALEDRLDAFGGGLQELASRSNQHEARFTELTLAVDEGIKHVSRAERRVKAAVQRTRDRLADLGLEDDGMEAEARELELGDVAGGRRGGVPPVPESVEAGDPDDGPSSIPGVTRGQLRRARGF